MVLTEDQAIEIFRLKDHRGFPTSHAASSFLANKYKVSSKAIRDIWSGRSWLETTYNLWDASDRPPRRIIGRPKGKKDTRPRTENLQPDSSECSNNISGDAQDKELLPLPSTLQLSIHLPSINETANTQQFIHPVSSLNTGNDAPNWLQHHRPICHPQLSTLSQQFFPFYKGGTDELNASRYANAVHPLIPQISLQPTCQWPTAYGQNLPSASGSFAPYFAHPSCISAAALLTTLAAMSQQIQQHQPQHQHQPLSSLHPQNFFPPYLPAATTVAAHPNQGGYSEAGWQWQPTCFDPAQGDRDHGLQPNHMTAALTPSHQRYQILQQNVYPGHDGAGSGEAGSSCGIGHRPAAGPDPLRGGTDGPGALRRLPAPWPPG